MSSEEPILFSVITVVYNDRSGLVRTSKSVLSQTCSDYEWIIVDGGSKDGTREFLETLSDKRVRWISEQDAGIYDAMNKGFRLASGSIVNFLNAGDTYQNEVTLAGVRSVVTEHAASIYYFSAFLVFPNGRTVLRGARDPKSSIWHGLPANHQATFYRRSDFNDRLYDVRYPVSSDYFAAAQAFANGLWAHCSTLVVARFYSGGNSTKKTYSSLIECWRIQRRVLRQNRFVCSVSFFRRFFAHRILVLLNWVSGLYRA